MQEALEAWTLLYELMDDLCIEYNAFNIKSVFVEVNPDHGWTLVEGRERKGKLSWYIDIV
jgi:hypothetical protein